MNDRRAQADRRKFDAGPPSGFSDRRCHEESLPPEIEILVDDMTTFTIRRLQYLAATNPQKSAKNHS